MFSLQHILGTRLAALTTTTVAAVTLVSCGEKQVDVVRPFRAQYADFQKQLADFAAQDPQKVMRLSAPLEPKPEYHGVGMDKAAKSNTAIFFFSQLTDVRFGIKTTDKLDPHFSDFTLTQLRVATLPEDQVTGPARVKQKEELTQALALRYIGAVKILTYKAGVIHGTQSFEPGQVTAVIMLFDRQTSKLVFADMISAKNDDQVSYTHVKGQTPTQEGIQGWVNSNLYENYRKTVLAKFAEGTGGIFVQ